MSVLLAMFLATPMLPVPQPSPKDYDACASYALEKKLSLVVFFHTTKEIYGSSWVATRCPGPFHIDPASLPGIVVFPFANGEFQGPEIAFDAESISRVIEESVRKAMTPKIP